ncbi:CocE/NonD family hydrolase [Nocardioides pocheonensis]|jgi:putative CocE/NonD family hydrolase|uniref:CocE/NonD family hydrolase n=1 Tax=Nocardioides pocheonensis TaxID=661485 RepID=A0A3N0GIG3_9ACTN|nr:CocE/NonD family hydrolase [Nocardioides pocheonensis]RNM11820.1 CocE/NonD family hydrolase [Nocardioides pocheonensis]
MSDIEIELDVPVPMRDGTVLRADVYRPASEGRFPVLLSRGPYNKRFRLDTVLDFAEAVEAGYIVVLQDTRGRFASDGEWLPWKYERNDGYDSVEWAANLPGSNGRVGMFGGSYLGSTQWSAAIAGAPSLKTIVPNVTWSDPENGLMFRGGAIEHGLNTWWTLMMSMEQFPKDGLDPDTTMGKVVGAITAMDTLDEQTYWQLPSGALPALKGTGHPDIGVDRALVDPATTTDCRVDGIHDAIELPTLSIAGWYDVFVQGSLDNYTAMRQRGRTARIIVGAFDHYTHVSAWQGGRIGDVNYGLMSTMPGGQTITQIHREWFDHWLKDEPATAAHESGVLLFTMGANQWRVEPEWPLARTVATPLYLTSDSALTWEEPTASADSTKFTYDPANPVLTRGGNVVMGVGYPAGPVDQREVEARDDVLVFTSAPLDTDVEITGKVTATLFAATDGPSTDWVVRLCEVDQGGVSRNLVDGITRVQTQPNRIEEVEVDLWSTSVLVKAGHRLRVHVTSSNFPRWDRNLNTGEPVTEGTQMRAAQQRILHDNEHPSRLVLPVIPAITAEEPAAVQA